MKTSAKHIGLLMAALPAAAATTPAVHVGDLQFPPLPAFSVPRPERVTLGNGLTVLLLPDRDLPLVQGTVLIHAGARLEPKEKVGLAAVTATVMRTGGTASQKPDQVDDLLEGIGASLELFAGVDRAGASFSCLSRDLETVLGVLGEVLKAPALAADRLEVARAQARALVARRNDNPAGITAREFAKAVYGKDSVYARHTEYATLDAIGRDDLVAFHRANFAPNRTVLGLVGDFDPRAARRLLEKSLGGWKRGAAAGKPSGGWEGGLKPGLYFVDKADVNQSNVWLGHLGITSDNPDLFAVWVMNELFGGGFSARLFSNVRSKKGLAYSVGGFIDDDYDHPATFRVTMSTKSETTVAGVQALEEEIDALLAAAPSGAELKRARDSILNSFIFRFDTKEKVLDRQVEYAFFGYPPDFLERCRAGIEKVTAGDVLQVARKYIHKDRLVKVVVGKSADFGTPLGSLGQTVTAVDITIPGAPQAKAASTK